MAKEKQQERQAAEVEAPLVPEKFGNYATAFMETKLADLLAGNLKLTGINNSEFMTYLTGYGLLKQKRQIDAIKKELGIE